MWKTVVAQDSLRRDLQDSSSSLYGNTIFSDFTFIVKGTEFKVHKAILATSSAVMHRLFTADYHEKATGQCEVDHIEPNIFEALICFIYCRKIPDNLLKVACKLYEAAHYYDIQMLKNICLSEIQMNLSAENVLEAYDLSFLFDLTELKVAAWEIIKRYVCLQTLR